MKLIVGVIVVHDDNDEKVETEILIYQVNEQTVMLKTSYNVFVGSLSLSVIK